MRKSFEKWIPYAQSVCRDQLQVRPVSKEEVFKHFSDLNQVMEVARKNRKTGFRQTQCNAGSERQRLAKTLLDRNRKPFGSHPPEFDRLQILARLSAVT